MLLEKIGMTCEAEASMTSAVVMRTSGGIAQCDPTENRLRALLGALARDTELAEQMPLGAQYVDAVRLSMLKARLGEFGK